MQFLTKAFHFCAAHQYGHEDWSDKKNVETFGADAQVHGHNSSKGHCEYKHNR